MLFGAAGQSLCFAMAAIGLGLGTKAMNGVAVAFIFLYYFFFVSWWKRWIFDKVPMSCRASRFWRSRSSTHPKSTRTKLETPAPPLPWSRTGAESTSSYRSFRLAFRYVSLQARRVKRRHRHRRIESCLCTSSVGHLLTIGRTSAGASTSFSPS